MFDAFDTQEMFGTFDTQKMFDTFVTVDTDKKKHTLACVPRRVSVRPGRLCRDASMYAPAACGAKRSLRSREKMGSINNFEVGTRRSHEKIGSKNLKLFMRTSMYYLYLSRFTPIT